MVVHGWGRERTRSRDTGEEGLTDLNSGSLLMKGELRSVWWVMRGRHLKGQSQQGEAGSPVLPTVLAP